MSSPEFPISDEQLQALPPEFRAMMEWALAEIKTLRDRVAELEEQLAQNSRNSSKPPSSDGPGQKASSPRKSSGKKRGGQKGHKKAQRELLPTNECNSATELIPENCAHCGERLAGSDPAPIRHQVWEIPKSQPIVDEYQQHQRTCGACGKATRAELPEGVPRGQAGPNLVAQVGLLLTKYRMSHRLAAGYLETHFGIPCSIGWISKLQATAANALASPYEQIAEQMKRAGVVHLDETSYRLENKSGWLWGAIATGLSLFRIAGSRAGQVAREMLGEGFPGIVVSDRYSGYHWLKTIQRQLCWSHLKRDFTKLAESKYEPTRQVGQQLLELQSRIFQDWHRFQAGKLARSTLKRKVPGWEGEMHALLERGWLTGPKKAAGLCRNVWKYFDALWTFLRLEGVEPTNNTAERGLRGGVIKRKLSFGVESQSGRAFLERTMSVLATCRQRGINESAYLAACVQAHYAGENTPDLLEWA